MKQKNRKRMVRLFGFALLGILIVLYIGLPVGMAAAVTIPPWTVIGSPPAGFEPVELAAEDGVALQGWYAPPENGAIIILLHGAGGSRETIRPYAEMLAQNGYGVLALDLRGHGESSGETNRLGWQGTKDVGAAVSYLKSNAEPAVLGGLGISMGGEILLGASAELPSIRAIAADGATRRCTDELLALPSEQPLIRSFTARLMFAAVRVFSGETPPSPLLGEMQKAGETAFFLIAAGENDLEVQYNGLFVNTVGPRAVVWVVPEVSHMGAYVRYPGEYEQRLIDFFDEALLGYSRSGRLELSCAGRGCGCGCSAGVPDR